MLGDEPAAEGTRGGVRVRLAAEVRQLEALGRFRGTVRTVNLDLRGFAAGAVGGADFSLPLARERAPW